MPSTQRQDNWSDKKPPVNEAPSPLTLPFKSVFSFEPLLQPIAEATSKQGGAAFLAREIMRRVEETPELQGPIEDLSVLPEHQDLVDMILSYVVPPHSHENHLVKIARPFSMDDIYVSPQLQKILTKSDVKYGMNKKDNILFCATLVKAGSLILNKFYGQRIDIDPPIMIGMQDDGDSLPRFYKANMDVSFVDVKINGELPMLTQQEIDKLLSNIYDTDRWLNALPTEKFEFQGFVLISMVDITTEEALSQIKHHLLGPEAVLYQENVSELEQLMRIYLGVPDLRLGVTAIDYPVERSVVHQYKIRFDFLSQEIPNLLAPAYHGSIYERVCQFRQVMLVEDLHKVKNKTALETSLIEQGLRSMIIATLLDTEGHVIGLVELGSPHAYGLHSFIELQFKEIISLFRTAVQRSREEVDNAIEAIIRDRYTALHPSVEWRFIEEAFHFLEKEKTGEKSKGENEIVFKDVYPLYGQADIVGSSTKRNDAIRADLITELTESRKVLLKSKNLLAFPLVDQALMELERELEHLQNTFNSNDEIRILDLVHTEVHPLLKQLATEHTTLKPEVNRYFNLLDKDLGIVYQQRRDYEKSVEAINELIGSFLDRENADMQQVLPHYFERYKTDGVEYNMYVGQSLLRKQDTFSQIHLRNFRLWQLIQMCEITRQVATQSKTWPQPLTTAQLIFAYTTPLSIRFRMDEKRFDVDGAYNVRYEILKKRIDKAVISGTQERITQSGHVSVVYLQEKDRQEYLKYAVYLLHHGYITGPPQDYELGALQGVQGLRALRMEVVTP